MSTNITNKHTNVISAAELKDLLAQPDVLLLDCRARLGQLQWGHQAFLQGHIEGAINIAHTRLASRLDELPTDTSLIVHCRSGVRSARASSFLQRRGFKVANLTGGYLAWAASQSNEPVT